MECNKEEAVRARGIAENKMQNKDFTGARRIAVKAQQLFPELDNISQMLTVCEVHCSAGLKVNGETDWYGVLQVEPTADEPLIKKQYRKLALLLHPDKNKFPGAEAAFKLIGEAHMILSDKGKRSVHDLKRGTRTGFPPNRTSFAKKQPGFTNNVPNTTTACPNGTNQQQAAGGQTFWTICPDCGMRYQYYRSILNRALRCQNCLKPFIAYDLNAQPVPPGANSKQSGIPPSHKSKFDNNPSKMGFQGNVAGRPMASEKMGYQGNVAGRPMASETSSRPRGNKAVGTSASDVEDHKVNAQSTGNEMKFEKVELKELKNRKSAGKPLAGNTSRKKGRNMVVESSDSEESTDSKDVKVEEVEHIGGQNIAATGTNPRRSTRHKQNVRYKEESDDDDSYAADNNADADTDENEDDDDFDAEDDHGPVKPPSPKRLKKSGPTVNTTDQCGKVLSEQDANEVKGQSSGMEHAQVKLPDGNETVYKNEMHKEADRAEKEESILKDGTRSCVDFSSKLSSGMDKFSYPDPEFHDFDNDRGVSKFAIDQIWAVYDDLDGMPRFYARISSICLRGFRIRFTWLEHSPNGEAEAAWSYEELPVACGSYRLGKSENSQDLKIFSHLMSWEKGSRRNTYDIYPKKGEVWALFKGWDIRWSSDAGNHRVYQYEVVEVLSDYAMGTDIDVVHLVKIKGFVGLFMRAIDNGSAPLRITRSEILRFSHRIPSYRMTGNEREGIPEGCFELDSASLPDNFGDIAPSISLNSATLRVEKLVNGCAIDGGNVAAGSSKRKTDLNENNTKTNTSKNFLPEQVNEVDMMGHAQKASNQAAAAEARSHKEIKHMEHKHQDNEKIGTSTQDVSDKADTGQQDASSFVSNSLHFEYPQSEFYTFEEERSVDKFQCGQIWALYSDLDKYPNYYGLVKKVEVETSKVQLVWLECSPSRIVEKRWIERELPICCGRFKVAHDFVQIDSTDAFSHLVQAKLTGRKDQYDIYPRTGEVWAIYKNWHVGWKCSDLENCEYDAVEILRCTSSGTEVQLLVKVDGYQAVFKPERKNGVLTKILVDEYLRFSHQIPAFKLTEERGGKLRGFWELDAASVPDVLLCRD